MKPISELRYYAAASHASIGQMYEPGVPYWIHLFMGELLLIGFGMEPRMRREMWGHDIPEDVHEKYRQLRNGGFTPEEARDICQYLTDVVGATREETKKLTLPKTAHGGFYPIGTKMGDRGINYMFGLLSGSLRKSARYRDEYPMFRHYLFDPTEPRLLPFWYFLDFLHTRKPRRIKKSEFEKRPLRLLINSWIERKDELFNADKVELLVEWHKLKALLDAELGLPTK